MKAKIKSKQLIAKGTLLVEYDLAPEHIDFTSGQYFHVLLKEGIKHHFTIVNSPNEKGIVSQATRMRDSVFKNTLKELPLGTEVEIYKIKGEFVLPEDKIKPLVFIALGIGITPYISMLRYIREEGLQYQVTLIYSDSDTESMAFLEELKMYGKDNPNTKLILTVTKDPNWKGESRHVDENFIKDHIDSPSQHLYYVSGPPTAVESVVASLEKVGIEKENIKSENFTGY